MSTYITTHDISKLEITNKSISKPDGMGNFNVVTIKTMGISGDVNEFVMFVNPGCEFSGFNSITDTPDYDGDGNMKYA